MPEIFERRDNEIPPDGSGAAQSPESAAERAAETRAAETGGDGRAEGRDDIRARLIGKDARGQEVVRRPVSRTARSIAGIAWFTVFFAFIYFLFIGLAAASPGYRFVDRIASIFLVLGSLFIFVHGLGYANSMIKSSWAYDEVKKRVFSPMREPKVACLIACFNEPLDVLEETVAAAAAMDYGNKEVVILDDSTKDEIRQGVRDIGARYGAVVRQRTNRRGYKAGAINDYLRTTDAPYVAIFDADGLAAHNLLRDLVPIIEENPRLAFVQTPQFYSNTDASNVALAAARQQSVFYEYICEGKSYSRAAFCCGTNVIFRRDALLDINGFDESSVTEDFVTSLALHVKGYDSTYYNQVYAYSMAPETLASYFTQQSRWAFGSIGGMGRVLKAMISRPGSMSLGQWWEYFLSTTYYWIGWVNFVFMLLPMLYIYLGVQPLHADVFTYAAVFIPYMLFSLNMFYAGMEARGYNAGDMLLGQQIGFLSFPVHMTAAISGILGLKRPFAVTPKGSSGKLGWLALWPQLLMLILSAVAFLWGMYRYFVSGTDRQNMAIVVNSIWCLYHVILLAGVFRLNRAFTARASSDDQRHFVPGQMRNEDGTIPGGAIPGGAIPVGAAGAAPLAPGASGVRGRLSRPPVATPLRPAGRRGKFGLILGVLSLVALLAVGVSMAMWYAKPAVPVNVYVLDRTTGRDYQEHRGLMWTLNQLKIRKGANFGPDAANPSDKYRWAQDYYGFVPDQAKDGPRPDNCEADLCVGGNERPLPENLETPGAVYLADTYGEFVEYDNRLGKYVKYESTPRGITPAEVDKIQDFYDRQGLLVAEWNTIGYPTLPMSAQSLADQTAGLQAAVAETRKGLVSLQTKELPARQAQLQQARAAKSANWQATMEVQVRETQDKINNANTQILAHQKTLDTMTNSGDQIAAQQQLEKMLHVNYQGWYGRYVDKFELEEEFDWRLYKNVDSTNRDLKVFPKGLRGPGFVFYKDGPSTIYNAQTKKMEPNPFSAPIIITQAELGGGSQLASGLYTSSKPEIAADPLLQGVAKEVPVHYWFDVVDATAGASVLAWYKMPLRKSAFDKLQAAGFPAKFIKPQGSNGDGQLVFPAAIAHRDNNKELRSFYFAGDASEYSLVPRIGEIVPATAGTIQFLSGRVGSYSHLYYWNYYEPLLKNVLTQNPRIRRKS